MVRSKRANLQKLSLKKRVYITKTVGQLGQWDKMKKEVKYQCVKILKLSQTSFFFWDNFLFFGTKIFLTVFRLIFEVIFLGQNAYFFGIFGTKRLIFGTKCLFFGTIFGYYLIYYFYIYMFLLIIYFITFHFVPIGPTKKGTYVNNFSKAIKNALWLQSITDW